MGIGPIGGPRIPTTPSIGETQGAQGLDKETLTKALQGDEQAIQQLAQKLGMDPEQLKALLQILGGGQQGAGEGGAPKAGGGGGGAPKAGGGEGAKGAGGPQGGQAPQAPQQDAAASLMSKFAENIQKGMPPQEALAKAVSDVKAEQQAKGGGQKSQVGQPTQDKYEAAPAKGPVDLGQEPMGENPVPPAVIPESI